jgi:hypothetical protein
MVGCFLQVVMLRKMSHWLIEIHFSQLNSSLNMSSFFFLLRLHFHSLK